MVEVQTNTSNGAALIPQPKIAAPAGAAATTIRLAVTGVP